MNICVSNGEAVQFELRFACEGEVQEDVPFTGEFLSKWITFDGGIPVLLMGLGKRAELDRKRARRAAAKGVSTLIE
ncbi:MAG: leucyl aminopeptidase family protein, partial [Faecalispora jeddahensis]